MNHNNKSSSVLVKTLIAVFSLTFLTLGLYFIYQQTTLEKNCTDRIDGVVVENYIRRHQHESTTRVNGRVTERSGEDRGAAAPVIEFVYKGKTYRDTSSVSSYPPKYSEGEHLVIFINPSDSTQWYISGDTALKTLGIVFVCIGAVFAAIFLIVLRGGKRIV
ncbi:MAG: DUF3592 domain-containing protein [Bacteroidales bacterium]|nr:DUF3592 domain-containing protein [Bacteroidales bacterium]